MYQQQAYSPTYITTSLTHYISVRFVFIYFLSHFLPSHPLLSVSWDHLPMHVFIFITSLILVSCSHTHASDMGSRFLAPYAELICSGRVSDFVTMSEPLDQGAKGQKAHLQIRCFLTCGRVEIPTYFHILPDMDSPVPWRYLWVGRCNDSRSSPPITSPLFRGLF